MVPLYFGTMKIQVKMLIDKTLAERFKQAVLARHGKLNLSREGEEAIRLYLQARPQAPSASRRDPLLTIIGIGASKTKPRPDALRDKRALYGG